MTAEQPLDRTTRAWLDLMPDEAPDRVIDAVLLAVDTAPQVRRPWIAGPTRSNRMNRLILIAATAAVVVGLLGGAALIAGGRLGPTPSLAPTSAPIATAVPSIGPSTAANGVPASLQSTWVGPPRDLPERGSVTRAALEFGVTGACLGVSSSPGCVIASSRLDQAGGNTLEFSTPTANDCAAGDTGSYPYLLSAGGRILTIQPGADPCAVRAAAFPGTWFRRSCTQPENGCLGDLEAGTYPTQFIAPKLAPSASWQAPWGAITYTVPEGWANSVDFPLELVLLPSSTYAAYTSQGGPANVFHDIQVLADPGAVTPDATCTNALDAAVPHTADGIADWIEHLRTVTVTNARATTIDGHHARQLDVAVDPAAATTCPDTTLKVAQLFAPVRADTGDTPDFGIAEGELIRVYLVDLGGGHMTAIVIDDADGTGTADAARFQSLVDVATPIVESFHFQ
jgi:hypothetical protein